MSSKIIDISAVTTDVTFGPSETETTVLVSAPTKVGTLARISLWVKNTYDCTLNIRRGPDVTGEVVSVGYDGFTFIDSTPSAQYNVTATGDGSETGTSAITLSIDQIA